MPEAKYAGAVGIKIEAKSDDFEKEIKKSSSEAAKTIENTLKDTAKSAKSKAATIAAVYKKQGYSQSEAMKKAWSQIERESAVSTAKVSSNIRDTTIHAQQAATKIKGSFKKIGLAIASAISVKMIATFGKQCIDLGSDLSEVQNVVDVTFKSMNGQLNQWAKNAASSYGLSETMAKKYAGLYGSMASAFGFAEGEAYDMATTLAGLSGDVASFYNISQDEAYTKLKAVFSGETEALKDLGIVMTQSALDSYALSNGFGKTVQQMTEAEKVSLRYNFVLSQLSGAQGDFLRTQDSWANQTRILQLRFDSLKATIGQGLIVALTPALKMLNTLIERVQVLADAFTSLMQKIFGASDSTNKAISSAVVAEQELTTSADESASSVDEVTKSINESTEAAKGSVASFDKLNIIGSPDNSSGSSASSGSASSASTPPALIPDKSASDSAKSFGDKFKDIFKGFYEKSGFKDFISKIQKGIDKVDWKSIGANCKSIFKNLQPIAKSYIKNTVDTGASALKAIGSYAGGMVSVFGKSLQTVSGGVAQWLSKDSGKITDFIENFNQSCQNGFDNLSDFFDSWFGLVGDSIDRMRPTVQNAISNYLSGITNFATSIGTVLAESFEIASGSLNTWLSEDGEVISEYFGNLQLVVSNLYDTFGTIFSDIGDIVSEWWNGEGGSSVFSNVCEMFTSIGTTFMSVWNEWIKPAWDFITGTIKDAWDSYLKPVFDSGISYIGKLFDCVSTLWNNILKPVANWLIETWGPVFTNVFNGIRRVLKTVFSHIGGMVSAMFKTFGGMLDFLTGVFSGDWKKAWQGIKDAFKGAWSGVLTVVSTVVNLIIDGINLLWNTVYNSFQAAANGIGGLAERIGEMFGQNWSFSVPENTPFIPRWEPSVWLAKGGIVKAPTLAVVGDNPGAGSGDPEVVSPLSKLQSMINTSSGQDVTILLQILDYLKRIYEMFVVFKNNGGSTQEFIVMLDDEVIFKKMRKQNELYKKRHNGESAF